MAPFTYWTSQFREIRLDVQGDLHDLRGGDPAYGEVLDPAAIARLEVWASGYVRRRPRDWSGQAFSIQQVSVLGCSSLIWRPTSSRVRISIITGTERTWIFFASPPLVRFIVSFDGGYDAGPR